MSSLKKKLSIAMITVGAAFLLTGCGKNIDLNKYTTVTVEGYEGLGSVNVEIDYEQMKEDFPKARVNGDVGLIYDSAIDLARDMVVNYYVENNGTLKNGENATVAWNCEAEPFKELTGYTLKYKDITVKVQDLPEIPTFDPFDSVTLSYEGWDGRGHAVMEVAEDIPYGNEYTFEIDNKSRELHNGDTLTVTYNVSNTNYLIQQIGMIPSVMEKTYTVEGLPTLVTSFSQLKEEDINNLIQMATDAFANETVNFFGTRHYENREYLAAILEGYSDGNIFAVLFQGVDNYNEVERNCMDLQQNLVVNADGSIKFINNDLTVCEEPEFQKNHFYSDYWGEEEVLESIRKHADSMEIYEK
jgi:hypothetical protein